MKHRGWIITRIAIPLLIFLVAFFVMHRSKLYSGNEDRSVVSKNSMKVSPGPMEEAWPASVRKMRITEKIEKKETANFYRKKIENLIKEREATRSVLLGEKDGTTRRGREVWYLLGITKPADEEVSAIRHEIANAMKECLEGEREKLDKKIGELINTYDPFGVFGDRVALITVPQDPNHPISAYIYPTTNFDAELFILDPDKPFNFAFDSSKRYFQQSRQPGSKDYGDDPFDRFSLVLKRD